MHINISQLDETPSPSNSTIIYNFLLNLLHVNELQFMLFLALHALFLYTAIMYS